MSGVAETVDPFAALAGAGPRRASLGRLFVSVASVGERCVLSLVGSADSAAIALLRAGWETVRHARERDVWIDLTHVNSLDSPTAHALHELHDALRRGRRRLTLIAPASGAARRAIAVAGLDGEFEVFADFASAHAVHGLASPGDGFGPGQASVQRLGSRAAAAVA